VRSALEQTRPDVVALAAGLSDIDDCERRPAIARATNVVGAANVARECARVGARLVFASSGAVFDGDAPEYAEGGSPNPLSVYGKTKAEAEREVTAECPGAIVVRLSLVLGIGLARGTNSWLDRVRAKFEAAQPVIVARDEYRNAIDVENAAQWMLDLAASSIANSRAVTAISPDKPRAPAGKSPVRRPDPARAGSVWVLPSFARSVRRSTLRNTLHLRAHPTCC